MADGLEHSVIKKLIDGYCKLLGMLMVLSLLLMVVLVFANVVLRYGFNSGLTLSEELSRWLFVWMTFMGAVVALKEHAHLGTDALVSRLPLPAQKFCLALSYLLMLVICWLVFKGGWEQVKINWGTSSAVMETSMAYFYVSGVLFSLLGGLILVFQLWQLLTGKTPTDKPAATDISHA
jgi:TRAP-type transport system small permease protein